MSSLLCQKYLWLHTNILCSCFSTFMAINACLVNDTDCQQFLTDALNVYGISWSSIRGVVAMLCADFGKTGISFAIFFLFARLHVFVQTSIKGRRIQQQPGQLHLTEIQWKCIRLYIAYVKYNKKSAISAINWTARTRRWWRVKLLLYR